MHRIQVQLTPEQARALKRMASREGKSVARLIRQSIDAILRSKGITDLGAQHIRFLAQAFDL